MATNTTANNFAYGYPWSWWIDPVEIVVVRSNPPTSEKTVIGSANGQSIVLPSLGRVCLLVRLNARDRFLPWIPLFTQRVLLPVPPALVGKYEVVLEPQGAQNLNFNIRPASALDDITP